MRRALLLLVALGLLALPSVSEAAGAGDLVFSELLIASGSGEAREWIEVYNPTGSAVDITGCTLADETGSTTLDPLTVQPGTYAILSKISSCVVYDDAGVCTRTADLVYSSLTLNNTTDSVTLTCDSVVVDTVSYDWSDFDDDCLAPGDGHCTANLRPEASDANSNDLWPDNWCVPPETEVTYDANGDVVLATPAEAGVCPKSGPSCGPGDVIFTEFMADPPSSSREWFELKVRTGSGCDLQGCELWEGTWEGGDDDDDDDSAGDDDDSAGDDDDDDDDPPGDWAIHTIDAAGDSLFIGAGTYALFAKTHPTVVGEEGAPDAVYADYVYSSLTLQNSDPALMRLVCEGVEIDAAPYDKGHFEDGCPEGGCSNNLRVESEDDLLNDDLGSWCLPPLEPEYLSSDGLPFIGTPGEPGACLERDWPVEGEVLFSEVMVQSIDFPEWFELVNLAGRDVDLGGCELQRVRLDQPRGVEDPTTLQTHLLGSLGEPPVMPDSEVRVFSKSDCLDGTEPSGLGTCLWGEQVQYTYSTVTFTNGEAERLSLYCPTPGSGQMVLVDAVEYDSVRTGNRSGHSMEFDVSRPGADLLNDDPYEWCEASFFTCVPELQNNEGECNYGTPGTVGPCTTGVAVVVTSGPGCICNGAAGSRDRGLVGFYALTLGLLLSLRRRREA
ncbi:MAG: lamin tail domain-containing protein [Myxococcota bacterium]|nr:lamin tail domain-containing protein [Myxococcota bacterium]